MRYLLLLLLSVAPSIHAHQLLMFAFQDSDRIQVSVYFAGGSPATANIELVDSQGNIIESGTSNADGQTSLNNSTNGTELIAKTADGHRAVWSLNNSDLSGVSGVSDGVTPPESTDGQPQSLYLAREIALLRMELSQYQSQIRFSDMVAGVAIILALAGWWLWWRERKKAVARQGTSTDRHG